MPRQSVWVFIMSVGLFRWFVSEFLNSLYDYLDILCGGQLNHVGVQSSLFPCQDHDGCQVVCRVI